MSIKRRRKIRNLKEERGEEDEDLVILARCREPISRGEPKSSRPWITKEGREAEPEYEEMLGQN